MDEFKSVGLSYIHGSEKKEYQPFLVAVVQFCGWSNHRLWLLYDNVCCVLSSSFLNIARLTECCCCCCGCYSCCCLFTGPGARLVTRESLQFPPPAPDSWNLASFTAFADALFFADFSICNDGGAATATIPAMRWLMVLVFVIAEASAASFCTRVSSSSRTGCCDTCCGTCTERCCDLK
jgi:hypothetical protein